MTPGNDNTSTETTQHSMNLWGLKYCAHCSSMDTGRFYPYLIELPHLNGDDSVIGSFTPAVCVWKHLDEVGKQIFQTNIWCFNYDLTKFQIA